MPRVVGLVGQLQGLQASVHSTDRELAAAEEKRSHGNGYSLEELEQRIAELTEHRQRLLDAFTSSLDQLEQLGALLKDLSIGLVDFYTIRDGDLVFLCWKLGEDRVGFWHKVEDGYAGRQAL